MKLFVNGQSYESAATNLIDLWREKARDLNLESAKGYAMALNGALVRKDQWEITALVDGDRIEVVRAMQGG